MAAILLIDDDEIHNKLIRDALRLVGCQVLEVIALENAESMIRSTKPELIIMDLFLPDRLGLLLIRQMHKEFPDLPIIAMTGESAITKTDYHRLAMNCGAVGVLTKPYSKIDLISMVKDAIGDM